MKEEADPLPKYAAMTVLVGLLGVAGAWGLPKTAEDRLGAFVGVGAAVFSGALALPLKKRALNESVQAALKVMGMVFGVRLVLVAAGLWLTLRKGAGPVPFTLGFFGVYFALQWIEISYVLAEQKRLDG